MVCVSEVEGEAVADTDSELDADGDPEDVGELVLDSDADVKGEEDGDTEADADKDKDGPLVTEADAQPEGLEVAERVEVAELVLVRVLLDDKNVPMALATLPTAEMTTPLKVCRVAPAARRVLSIATAARIWEARMLVTRDSIAD